jgi:hypothetical protein
MKTKPIKPEEVGQTKKFLYPTEIIQAVNELIAEKFSSNSSVVTQNEIISRAFSITCKKQSYDDIPLKKDIFSREVFDKGWLNIETIYEEAGWVVEYDKPGYEATFTFTKKKN